MRSDSPVGRVDRVGDPSALAEVVPGGVSLRSIDVLAYAHDASHFRKVPQAVVTPRDAGEVAALMGAAGRNQLPITFRSGGTSLSGQASTDNILVDTRRHFRGIEVLDGGARVRAQPGATVRGVNIRLARYGRQLGPDPASEIACTIGGVVANNSSGMSCGVHANTYRTLDAITLVLPSGTVVDTGLEDADERLREDEPGIYEGLLALQERVLTDRESLATIGRLFSMKNTMGYGLNSYVDFERPVDILAHLAVGSEGTLCFIADATFRTLSVKPHAATALAVFPSLADATASLPDLVNIGLTSIELLDARSLAVAQQDSKGSFLDDEREVGTRAALMVETQASSKRELAEQVQAVESVLSSLPVVAGSRMETDALRRSQLWKARKGLYAAVASRRPRGTTALLEDVAVPVASLLETCQALAPLLEDHGYEETVIFGHAKDGNLHFMLNERFDQPGAAERYISFTDELAKLVLGHAGTLKAEHGTGRAMAPYVRLQYGDELYGVMVSTKRLLDPAALLGPGILIDEGTEDHVQDLKESFEVDPVVDKCVECGYCEPACPSKDLTLTPRQRIVLLREIARAEASGDTGLVRELERHLGYEVLDTCAVDGMCQDACPVAINTGDLVQDMRSSRVGRLEQGIWNGAARHWSAATRAASASLTAASNMPQRLARSASSAMMALGRDGRVPAWSPDLPAGGSPRKRRDSRSADAVYFPACVSAVFGPAEGSSGVQRAFPSLCERAGLELATPQEIDGLCCGTPWKSKGLQVGYDTMARKTIAALVEVSKGGRLPIVCDATSCAGGLGSVVRAHAAIDVQILDVVSYVSASVLPLLPPVQRLRTLVVHPTCASEQLGVSADLMRIAEAIADEVIVPSEWGCCGFAGDRGLLRPELTAAATAPEAQEVASLHADAYVSANRTCEMAMTRATGRPYRHVLEVLLDQLAE